jgi:hypothetical protein
MLNFTFSGGMNGLLTRHLSEIYNDFCKELDGLQKYCELCEVCFLQRRIPNYRSIIQQQLYLLRYLPAYLFEYFEALSYLVQPHFITQPAKIVSLGCGSGIDGAAAHFAFREYSYHGIDLVKWNYWPMVKPPVITNASEFIPGDQNIFIFPKSLSEFSEDVVETLANNLPKTQAHKICIINSRRNPDSPDGVKCRRLLEAFGATANNIQEYTVTSTGKTLTQYQNWKYPNRIINHIKELSSHCPESRNVSATCCTHSDKPCINYAGEKFETPMERHPILTDKYFCTDIYSIQR